MTRIMPIILIAAIGPLLAAAAYFSAPVLLSSRDRAVDQAESHLERARRLLIRYSENQERLGEIIEQLRRAGLNDAADADQIAALMEQQRAVFEDKDKALKETFRGTESTRRRELDERYRAAGGEMLMNFPAAGGIGVSPDQWRQSVQEGIRARDRLFQENEQLISQAAAAVQDGLSITVGNADGSAHPQANRLQGVVMAAQADAAYRRGMRQRTLTAKFRHEFLHQTNRIQALAIDQQIVESSGIHDHIDSLRASARDLSGRIEALIHKRDELQQTISQLEKNIAAAEGEAAHARGVLEEMEDRGANLLSADGATNFASQYLATSAEYRDAIARAQRVRFGSLQNAEIDDSGDFLTGSYVPAESSGEIIFQRGLVDFQHDLQIVTLDLESSTEELADVETNVSGLLADAERLAQSAVDAKTQSSQATEMAAVAFREAIKLADEAAATLDQAVRLARSAINALRSASGVAGNLIREAGDRIADKSPAIQDRSASKVLSQSGWLSGQINNETALVQLQLAEIHLHRYLFAASDHALASMARERFGLEDATPDAVAATRDQARSDAIEAARGAVRDFERSSRELSNNWTVAAQVGAAHDLLATLEGPGHLRSAIDNYTAAEQAIAGRSRELQHYAPAIVNRLRQLRNPSTP